MLIARIAAYVSVAQTSWLKPALLSALLLGVFSTAIAAQDRDDADLQLWNDIDLTVPINDRFAFNATGTLWIGNNISHVDSARFSTGITYRASKAISVAPFVMAVSARNSAGRFRYEYRAGVKINYRFPIEAVAISHRSRFEHRSKPGRNSWRYRPLITIKRKLPDAFIKDSSVYVTDEAFYDSVSGRFSRNRISFGLEKKVNKKLAISFYYLYQGDNISRPNSINVLGTNWKISL